MCSGRTARGVGVSAAVACALTPWPWKVDGAVVSPSQSYPVEASSEPPEAIKNGRPPQPLLPFLPPPTSTTPMSPPSSARSCSRCFQRPPR